MRHDWPGNVRELENAVERALVVGRGHGDPARRLLVPVPAEEPKGGKTLEDVERAHIERILRETQHNLSRAARILDIDRTTLYNKLRRYGSAVKPIHLIPLGLSIGNRRRGECIAGPGRRWSTWRRRWHAPSARRAASGRRRWISAFRSMPRRRQYHSTAIIAAPRARLPIPTRACWA